MINGNQLSGRFLGDSTWKQLWENAKACPAHKQKPLFDEEKEIAKAFHYFETLSLQNLLLQLKPIFFITAYENLISQSQMKAYTPVVCSRINALSSLLCTKSFWLDEGVEREIIELFSFCESSLLLAEILLKSGLNQGLVDRLLEKSHVTLSSMDKEDVRSMIMDFEDDLPTPDKKVYSLSEANCISRMSFSITNNSFSYFWVNS